MIIITALYLSIYVILTTIFLGWQTSISNTYKELSKIGLGWIFVIFMFGLGFLCIFTGKNNAMTISGFGCFFVACFPRFYDDQSVQHYLGALCIIIGGLWHILELWYLPLIFVIGAILMYKFITKNYIFWIEILAFSVIIYGMLAIS